MLVRLIALSNKTMHTIALLYAISFCYRPHWESLQEKRLTTRAVCSHAVTRPLLQTYTNTTSHAHYRCITWKSRLIDQTGGWGGVFLVNVM